MTQAPEFGLSPRLGLALAFSLLLAALDFIYRPFFPIDPGYVGHDYSLAMTDWLDGYYWFRNNGFAVPWFTPSFCAGQPFFPDPQSAYYSFPQLLAFAVSPLATAHLTFVVCAALQFWGGYLLMRRVFGTGMAAAVLVGGLLMFNGFLPHRLLVGHTSFHGVALIPWLALLLMMPVRRTVDGVAAAGAAGVLLAYWVHSGFGTLILAGGLAVLLLALAYGLRGGSIARFLVRGMGATAVGLALSAGKLSAAAAFLGNFPRTDYLLPGFASFYDSVIAIAGSLFLPSEWAFAVGTPRLTNVQWGLAPHEWAFNFSFAAGLTALLLLVARLRRPTSAGTPNGGRWPLLALLLIGVSWPLLFNTWDPEWNAFLKTVPILNSASSALRWVIAYIAVIAVAIGLLLDGLGRERAKIYVAAICLLATVLQTAFEPRSFYRAQSYDVRPLQIADALTRAGRNTPEIHSLGNSAGFAAGEYRTQLTSNDTFIAGVSRAYCYNPVFGYRLEKFSAEGLVAGSVLQEQNGHLNLKNPACYVFPKENNCRPGDLFRADQVAEVRNFISYRPFPFNVSQRQEIADEVSKFALLVVGLASLLWAGSGLRRRNTIKG